MSHDPLCPMLKPCDYPAHEAMHYCDICGRRCGCILIAKARADQDYQWVQVVRNRLSDLESCTKPDNCATKAEGVQLIIDDAIGDLGISQRYSRLI